MALPIAGHPQPCALTGTDGKVPNVAHDSVLVALAMHAGLNLAARQDPTSLLARLEQATEAELECFGRCWFLWVLRKNLLGQQCLLQHLLLLAYRGMDY